MSGQEELAKLPKMDVLLAEPALIDAAKKFSYTQVKLAAEREVDRIRQRILDGESCRVPELFQLADDICTSLESSLFELRRVVNATGVVLHTNLGRAPLGTDVADHVTELAAGYANVEYDLAKGVRGGRGGRVQELLCDACGAEAALVVNNNAAAVFLMLHTLCAGAPVAISRGQLVEIGGKFRVPDIMAEAGAELVEVGTTNKTHLSDYKRALEQGAAALLKVHTSNFVMRGFTSAPGCAELAELARAYQVPLIYDMGAASLFSSDELGIAHVQSPREALAQGANLVSFSADKLLGSVQAGIIVGDAALIEQLAQTPLYRMMRPGKLTLAALEATLVWSRSLDDAKSHIPTIAELCAEPDALHEQAMRLADKLDQLDAVSCEVVPVCDEAGGGSLPGTTLEGWGVAVSVVGWPAERAQEELRHARVPIISLLREERLLFSARCLLEGDDACIYEALASLT